MKKALVRSRDALSDKELQKLKRKFGVDVIENKRTKKIAAGFTVEIDDVRYDYSLNTQVLGNKAGTKKTIGKVIATSDGVAMLEGIPDVAYGEILTFASGAKGLALNLLENEVGVILLEGEKKVVPGELVETTGQILSVPVGNNLIGRVISPLGEPLDGKGGLENDLTYPIERIAPGVLDRKSVTRPLQTGVMAVDSMIPIGRGQRELIIGDRQTGKTTLGLTTIINQSDVVCVYVAIGQKNSSVAQFVATLAEFDALKHSIVVVASSADSAAMQYIAPYAGCAIAEYFMDQGKDSLVIFDDLSKHAWAYRQISLLLGRPSGREAYPGDIFYAHSRLLERACQLSDKKGAGSLTALPIIETLGNDVSAYIPTNVISITDGQIYLIPDLFNAGQRPAIDVGNSVSRVGSSAQIKSMKEVSGRLRIDLAQYQELEAFSQFAGELDEKTQKDLNRGPKLYETLKQNWSSPLPVEEQIVILWAAVNGYFDKVSKESITEIKASLLEHMRLTSPKTLREILEKKGIDEGIKKELDSLVTYIVEEYQP